MKPTYRIEEWSVVDGSNNPYLAPELRGFKLHGKITGHRNERVTPDKACTTSLIQKLEIETGYIETYNSVYELGAVDQAFVDHCFSTCSRRTIVSMAKGGFLDYIMKDPNNGPSPEKVAEPAGG